MTGINKENGKVKWNRCTFCLQNNRIKVTLGPRIVQARWYCQNARSDLDGRTRIFDLGGAKRRFRFDVARLNTRVGVSPPGNHVKENFLNEFILDFERKSGKCENQFYVWSCNF